MGTGSASGASAVAERLRRAINVHDGRLRWGRLYMEQVERSGEGMRSAVRDMGGRHE